MANQGKRRNKKHLARMIAFYRARELGWLENYTHAEIGEICGVHESTISRNIEDLDGVKDLIDTYLEQLAPHIKTKAPA